MSVRCLSRRRFGAVTTASLMALATSAWAQQGTHGHDDAPDQDSRDRTGAIPVGSGECSITAGGAPLSLFTYKAPAYVDGPLIVVCHGIQRNAGTYRNNARVIADRHDALIVAPEFDQTRFSRDDYESAGVPAWVRGWAGAVPPAGGWMADVMRAVIGEIRTREARPEMPVFLIGHAAGAQFVTKFAAFDTLGAQRIVAANAASYLMPTRDAAFPYGFGGMPDALSNDAALARYLAAPLTLYLGTEDRLVREARWVRAELDDSDAARAQGASGYERGLRAYDFGRATAQSRGWAFGWRLVEAPGVSHASKQMFENRQSSVALFGA